MYNRVLKNKVIELRKIGNTYGEIRRLLNIELPKSTLSNWCSGILLSKLQKERILKKMQTESERGRQVALIVKRKKRQEYLLSINKRVSDIHKVLKDKNVAKMVLAMLYLAEGSKTKNDVLDLGNSDPEFIKLFLLLMRRCYFIDEKKFRCVLQCRADQDIESLEKFWSIITKIPKPQFYRASIDPRTVGRPSKKPNYKGVCRITYFSADLALELKEIVQVVFKNGPVV